MKTIKITVEGGQVMERPANTQVRTLLQSDKSPDGLPYLAAMVNNEVSSLSYPLKVNCAVRFLTMSDPHGWHVYRRSVAFLLAKAARELYPDAVFSLEHSLGSGLYCSFSQTGADGKPKGISKEQLDRIESRMRETIERDAPIERHQISYTEAVRQFEATRQTDKLHLLAFRNPPKVVIHSCEGFSDLAHGPLASGAGALRYFGLIHYPPGFVLHLPQPDEPAQMPPFKDQPHLFHILQEHKEWGRILGVTTVGRLNEVIERGEVGGLIRISEALHEKKVAIIADEIFKRREKVKLILVCGPSASGKTTFSKRLAIQLQVNGLRPVMLSLDDYFLDLQKTPRDKSGNPDFENIEAIDLKLFNEHLAELIRGKEIEMPHFNFLTKQREHPGAKLAIGEGHILIVEGIHGLNPRLTQLAAPDSKFKIYINALAQLSIDSNNRISTTDNRLMRRLVRDNKFRGHPALATFKLWPAVRQGEERWIFPHQQEADATFNSALDYELAVLKPMVEPLLMQVKPHHMEYAEARRLSEFLLNFLAVSDRDVPHTSILREYIGRSAFHY